MNLKLFPFLLHVFLIITEFFLKMYCIIFIFLFQIIGIMNNFVIFIIRRFLKNLILIINKS